MKDTCRNLVRVIPLFRHKDIIEGYCPYVELSAQKLVAEALAIGILYKYFVKLFKLTIANWRILIVTTIY